MKTALLLLLTLVAFSQDFTVELNIFGLSEHTNKKVTYNETNPGLGLNLAYHVTPHWDMVVATGFYEDSFYKTARLIVTGPRLVLGNRNKSHVTVAILTGYLKGSSYEGIAPIPVISIGYDWLDLCITGDPTGTDNYVGSTPEKSTSGSIALFLKLNTIKF